jgi:hypothetical protein
MFVSGPIDYNVRGIRRWDELTEAEQDEYLLSCFDSESKRADVERRLCLFDRVAGSIATHLLGVYQQFDVNDGVAHYAPPTPRVAAHVLELRRRVLKGTSLGARLDAALARAEGKPQSAEPFQELEFYSVAPSEPGMEILHEKCSDDSGWMVPTGFTKWNNFDELDRLHYRETSARWATRQAKSFDNVPRNTRPPSGNNNAPREVSASAMHAAPTEAKPESKQLAPIQPSGPLVYVSAAVACAVLAGAFAEGNPSWYFTMLRILVSGALTVLAVTAFTNEFTRWASVLGVAAVVYNPLIPLHLGRAIWQPVNVVTIVLIVLFSSVLWWTERRRHMSA